MARKLPRMRLPEDRDPVWYSLRFRSLLSVGLDTAVWLSGDVRRTSSYGGGPRTEAFASIVDKLTDTCSIGLGSMTEGSLAIFRSA